MHMYLVIWTTLIFLSVFSFPLERIRRADSKSSTSTNQTSVTTSCHFSIVRKNSLEKTERPIKSVVSTTCSGDIKKIGELEAMKATVKSDQEHPLSLLLCRGAGLCNLDFSKSQTFNSWKDVSICHHHLEELFSKWSDVKSGFRDKHMYRSKTTNSVHSRAPACSMPNGLGVDHEHRPTKSLVVLTINEANEILKNKNVLVHPGIPICTDHKKFVDGIVPKSNSPPLKRMRMETTEISDSEEAECSVDPPYVPYFDQKSSMKRSFLNFAKDVGISRVCTNLPWNQLKVTTKERKANAARTMIDAMLGIMVPDSTLEFRQLVEKKIGAVDSWTSGSSELLDTLMNQIAAQYFSSEDRNNRYLILSLVANSVSYLQAEKYISGISSYMYDKAKKFARRKRGTQLKVDKTVVKYNSNAIDAFIEFITSPSVMTGLPYGVRNAKLTNGAKIQIPDSIRQQSSTEVIEMYQNVCKDNGREDLLLGVSSMYKILNVCAATKRESTTCVDYFLAMGSEGFDSYRSVLQKWKKRNLFDHASVEAMDNALLHAAQYYRTDFGLHVKNFSRVADHCAAFALSDPNDANFATSCSNNHDAHTHDLKCDRCENADAILKKIEDHAKEFVSESEEDAARPDADDADRKTLALLKDELALIQKSKKHIFEMKKHVLRAAVTNQERGNLLEGLKDNEAMITIDFAQKFIPKWHREKQTDYYGKKGISYHISHISARIGEVYAQHSFVHIFDGAVTQDSELVIATLSHVLKELKKVGIVKVFLRSDNAGAYHCAATIGSLLWLSEETKMPIGSYTFSESQNGKSSSDRDANRVKRRVKEYVNQGNDVTTSAQFFKAIEEGPPNGISVYHGTVTTTAKSGTEWKGISNLNYFTIDSNGIRARRYADIGSGLYVGKSSFKPIKGNFEFKEAGFVASKVDSDAGRIAEREAVIKGQTTQFWYHAKCSKTASCVHEPDEISPTIEEFVSNGVIGDLFSCPHPGCSSTFLKFSNLEKHLLRGKHNIAPEKVTARDYALNLFARKLEDATVESTCPVVADAVKKMKESKADQKLSVGWALPEKRTRKVFEKDVVDFLIECYNKGEKNKRPMNPVSVSDLMLTVTKSDGSRRFTAEEQKDPRQIAAFFSREAEKRRRGNDGTTRNSTKQRRSWRRPSSHQRKRLYSVRRRRYEPTSTQPPREDYVEDEEEHPDSGWIRYMRLEEFWSQSDEFYDAIINHPDFVSIKNS